ncbi:MAG: hypothetical protein D6800_00030 [Candidatus Zixiibacteriota bacterium]|nr:MAG: hypothetical protein D6800_00030 [candidate division Zixibacteria bacterium]
MKIITKEQYTPEWWEARRGVPTASNARKIMTGTGKVGDHYSLIYKLIADLNDPNYGVVDDYQTAAMKNGHIIEPEARQFYEFETDRKIVQVGFCMDDEGRWGFSPDALVQDKDGEYVGGLEIKCPQLNTHLKWLSGGVVPTEHRPQVYFSLAASGLSWWDFMSYHPGMPALIVRVEQDDEMVKKMREYMDKFWTKFVLSKQQIDEIMKGEP